MQIPDILKKKLVQMTSVGIVTFVGGTGLGYVIGKRQAYRKKSENDIETAIEHVKAVIDRKVIHSAVPSIKEEVDIDEIASFPVERRICVKCGATNGKAHLVKYNFYYCSDCINLPEPVWTQVDVDPDDDDDDTPDFEPVVILNHDDRGWDYEEELSTRDPMAPYVIHQEEFINDEMGYHQETLSYYAGDDIMADTDDTPIYNYSGLMGELKFGHGSRDPNVVYIRNEAIHMEWEVLLNPDAFSEEVLGLALEKDNENDLRHSVQKFRRE